MDWEKIEEDAVRITDILCRQPSVSAEGRALDETAELVEELLAGVGFETRQLRADEGPAAVYAEQEGRTDFTLLLYNHYDVQPVDPLELWDSPPFEPVVRDGNLYARGTSDNKAELAVRLAVIRALRDEDGELPIRVKFIVEGEEEVGSPNFDEIVKRNADLLRADGSLWEGGSARLPDGRPEFALGFKGMFTIRLDVRCLDTDAHSSLAVIAPSAPWRLVEALMSIRLGFTGYHDSVRPPTEAERRALAEASSSDEQDLLDTLGIDGWLDGLSGPAVWEHACYTPTMNIAGIHTGYGGPGIKTVLPKEASAWMDFRLVPDQTPDEVHGLLRAHLDREGFEDVEITELGHATPAKTPLDDPFVQRVVRVAEAEAGMAASIMPIAPATLPIVSSLQQHVGVPGCSAPDNPVYAGSRAHAPNEHIRLDDVGPAVRFTYALLRELAE